MTPKIPTLKCICKRASCRVGQFANLINLVFHQFTNSTLSGERQAAASSGPKLSLAAFNLDMHRSLLAATVLPAIPTVTRAEHFVCGDIQALGETDCCTTIE